jgi:hypothetical protein
VARSAVTVHSFLATLEGHATSGSEGALQESTPPSNVGKLTNRLSSRLKCVSNSVRADPRGSLRVADSAAQLNSMLEFPKLHVDDEASPVGQSIDREKT